jgi:hypothetical protein
MSTRFFPEGNDDSVWIENANSWIELYQEVQKKYATSETLKPDFESLFTY